MSSGESSGTATMRDDAGQPGIFNPSDVSIPSPENALKSSTGRPGETLESHEVIELQMFSERKAWIEEKIKLLEQMPPIEVFVGLDAVKSSAEEVPGLPTRADLKKWLAEHDTVEKETEIFDTGELTKLRKFTRAATQRNLSPEDTDLIELTLTTIYALDKLLHLLRDRSENLDLLGVRLSWEESRVSSWVDRRHIIADLQNFLESRARWSPAVYDNIQKPESYVEDPRRGSIGSVISIGSVSSDTSINSPGFSRSTRFKLAELLSRDAAAFSGRLSALRHGSVAAAGKHLDKLIDHSRRPVPEELLDEQDKLEEKCITDMETIGKFVLNVVMQWRKADEIHVETMKDQFAAQTLMEEIETAKTQHPTARQSASFVSRSEALLKRLYLRGNPASPTSTFPRPQNSLFPDQMSFNDNLAESLSSDISTTTSLTKTVESLAKDYKASYEAVKRVETITEAASEQANIFASIIERLQKGVISEEGDGSPPSLTSSDCLEPTRHSVFIALLPSILEDLSKADTAASQLLRDTPAALLRLDFPGVDPEFKLNASSLLRQLSSLRDQALRVRDDVTGRMSRLREARKIWSAMHSVLKDLENIRREVVEEMETCRWHQDTTSYTAAPPTPESPPVNLPSVSSQHTEFGTQLTQMGIRMDDVVDTPLTSLSTTLELALKQSLSQTAEGLRAHFLRIKQMVKLLQSIRNQASVMKNIRDEFNDLQLRIDDLTILHDANIRAILDDTPTNDVPADETIVRSEIISFIDTLSQRAPLVAQSSRLACVKRSFSSLDLAAGFAHKEQPIELPFDLHNIDDSVRADCNSYSMRLNGQVEVLKQKLEHVQLARIAKEIDYTLSSTLEDVGQATQHLSTLESKFKQNLGQTDIADSLNTLMSEIQQSLQVHRFKIRCSLSTLNENRRHMESAPGAHDSGIHDELVVPRIRAINDAESRLSLWEAGVESLCVEVQQALQAETRRLEEERQAYEERVQEERRRLDVEEAERARAERERLEEDERLRLEERLAEEARIRAEEEEIAKKEKEKHEAAERLRLEERLAEERRIQAEKERQASDEAEKIRLEKERFEMEVKLKLAEGQLLEERRLHAEKQRLSEQEAEKIRLEREKLDKERERQLQVIKEWESSKSVVEEDVFGERTIFDGQTSFSNEMKVLLASISRLRKRLRSIGINDAARPSSSSSILPGTEQVRWMRKELSALLQELSSLPSTVENVSVNVQLKSFKSEADASVVLMDHVEKLASLCEAVANCDAALSDLLEHIDSFPAAPLGPLSSSYTSSDKQTPEEQLSGRLSFTKHGIDEMLSVFEVVKDDLRAIAEHDRIVQTWSELEDMGNDRISGKKSRPSSVTSSGQNSGRSSRISVVSPPAGRGSSRKSSGYAALSAASASRGRLNVPVPTQARRAVSGSDEPSKRPTSSLSTRSFQRSTSGPLKGSLYGSTFASRQRTTSLTPSTVTPPIGRVPSGSHVSSLSSATRKKRSESPSISDASLSHPNTGGRGSSASTWSRAPRISFPNVPRSGTPQKKTPAPRKTYVANPKSKLDVAVGDVVNSLPIGINIEGVSGSWKDQSGKYWIGDQDPKLCFCRILRSQTVMVRVGGGWMELSKFIRSHLADSFRLLSESPPNNSTGEEKWISSATLLEVTEQANSPPFPPRTPEPKGPFIPSFALSTPSGHSPHSLKSTPSTRGSPLTPLQFLRRAEPDAPLFARPETPTKTRTRTTPAHTPARHSVWRP